MTQALFSGNPDRPIDIYRLLVKGEPLQGRDQVYDPKADEWLSINLIAERRLIDTAYDPTIGPVRRFNKTPPTQRPGGE